jgi:quercetin dioxygenase-like cupin family protein
VTFGRRVVTGPAGLVADGASALTIEVPGGPAVSELLWLDGPLTEVDAAFERSGDDYPLVPPVGGASARLIRLPADGEWLVVDLPDGERASLHATDTLDFVVVVEGDIELGTGDGSSVRLGRGGTVVQRGARHRWRVVGDAPCTYAVVMLRPDPAAGPATPLGSRDGTGGRPRVVTAGDGLHVGTASVVLDLPATRLSDLWHTGGPLRTVDQGGDPDGAWALESPPGGASFRMVELDPGLPEDEGWHHTESVDVDVVLSGRIGLDLEGDVSVELGPGDTVLQRGAHHRWRVLGDEPVHLAVTMLTPGRGGA